MFSASLPDGAVPPPADAAGFHAAAVWIALEYSKLLRVQRQHPEHTGTAIAAQQVAAASPRTGSVQG